MATKKDDKENKEEKALAVKKEDENIVISGTGFGNSASFGLMQRQASLLAASQLIPKEFQNNIPNVVIALELANRIGASPISVMQNLYIVHGKPSWSSQFIIAAINNTKKYTPLRFEITGEDMNRTCTAWAVEKETGERLEGPPVSMQMAKDEGWLEKNGSKWKTMPELMLRYRSATFFGRLYAPEILMGMQTQEEAIDITSDIPTGPSAKEVVERFRESVSEPEEEAPAPSPPKEEKKAPEKKDKKPEGKDPLILKKGEPLPERPIDGAGECTEDPKTCGLSIPAGSDTGCGEEGNEFHAKRCPFQD